MECNCQDWKENIDKLNTGFMFLATRGGKGYTGKIMEYCPWCGKKLLVPKKKGVKNAKHV